MATEYKLTYYPWITQGKEPAVIRANIEILAESATKELQAITGGTDTIKVQDPLEVPEQIESIVSGESQIALMNPIGFVFAKQKSKEVDVAALALRIIDGQVGETYFSQIYTHVDTGIKSLNDLKKKSMGYGASFSTSNFLVAAHELLENHLHPFITFSKTAFLGGHQLVAKAVYAKQIDAGAGHDGVIIDLAAVPGYEDAKDKLVTIHRSQPIISDPVAFNIANKDDFKNVRKALVKASLQSPAKEAIAIFWGNAQGLKKTNYKPYKKLLVAVKALQLTEEDIFG